MGAALTFPLCGLLVQTLGWPAVFYGSGLLTVLWLGAWQLLVFDSPAKHPRIAEEERRAIEKALGGLVDNSQVNLVEQHEAGARCSRHQCVTIPEVKGRISRQNF